MQTDFDTTIKSFVLKAHVFTFPVLQVLDANPEIMPKQIEALLAQSPTFFNKAPLVLDLQSLKYHEDLLDFNYIKHLFSQYQLYLIAIRGGTPLQQKAAEKAGLPVLTMTKSDLESRAPSPSTSSAPINPIIPHTTTPVSSTKLVTKPVRSGQQIYAKNSDLIILAPVSVGAEVLADGNIHIYGALRGRALAGIHGDKEARIFCSSMEAELISIASFYLVNEALNNKITSNPTQIYLQEDILQIEPLNAGKHD